MSSQKSSTPSSPSIGKAFNSTLKSLRNNPALFTPFIIFAIIEITALILIFLIPRMPLRAIFGPPIRTFWGEQFLHYPFNFLLLSKLTSLSRMFLSVVFGSLLTAVAVAMVFDVYNKKKAKFSGCLKSSLKKYLSLFTIVFIFTLVYYISVKIITIGLLKYFAAGHSKLLFIGVNLWLGPLSICINFIAILFRL